MSLEHLIKKIIGSLLFAGALAISGNALAQEAEPKFDKYDGFCYGQFRKNQNPDKGVHPIKREIKEDISHASKFTKCVRSYGATQSGLDVPEACREEKLDCYAGAWIGKYKIENEKEISNLIKIANSNNPYVKGVVVGNEVLLRKDLAKQEYLEYIQRVKKEAKVPVGIAETWKVLLENKDLAEYADFILVHIHPYWDGVSIEKAVEHVFEKYELVKKAFPGKNVIIGETGWPSRGDKVGKAVPSLENQVRFFESFTKQAKEKKIPYFYFEVFNEEWKIKFEGKAGAYWGIFNSDGSLDPMYKQFLPKEAMAGIKRPARIVEKVKVNAPVTIYSDGGSDDNHFQPTGWMTDEKNYINLEKELSVERDCRENPHSGKSCTKITYSPGGLNAMRKWAGIFWQHPINNWGEYPGYEINGQVSKATFWARGEKGGEKIKFQAGGINCEPHNNPEKPYKDSFGPVEKWMKLTKDWQKYEINLRGEDLSNVIGGFCFATSFLDNNGGCVFYLDDIVIE